MSSFSLRKLEMAHPWLEKAKENDPKHRVMLAALALADEETLKLIQAGNDKALEVFINKAYDMDPEEVATLIGFFINRSQRFTLLQIGLSTEEVNQLEIKKIMDRNKDLGIQ